MDNKVLKQPIEKTLNDKPNSEIIIYEGANGQSHIKVQLEGETVWLNQAQLVELFQSSRTNIVEHIQHIYEENELTKEATCRNFRQVRTEGARQVEREIPFTIQKRQNLWGFLR